MTKLKNFINRHKHELEEGYIDLYDSLLNTRLIHEKEKAVIAEAENYYITKIEKYYAMNYFDEVYYIVEVKHKSYINEDDRKFLKTIYK